MFKFVVRLSLVISVFAGSFFLTAYAQPFFTSTPQTGDSAMGTTTRRTMTVEEFRNAAKKSAETVNSSLDQQTKQQLTKPVTPPAPGSTAPSHLAPSQVATPTSPTTQPTLSAPSTPAKPQEVYTGFKPAQPSGSGTTTKPSSTGSGSGSSGGWNVNY